MTCAYYLRQQGHSVTVIDKMEKAGGVLRYGIPHYRLPKSTVDQLVAALEGMGIQFKMGVEVGKDIQMADIESEYDSVYIGTGAWKQPILGIDGENLTQFGMDFLVEVNKYLKKAVNFGDNIIVCGGGYVAMDVALTAKRLGAKNVTLVCLEKACEMPAAREEIERAVEEGVVIRNSLGLSKVVESGGKVVGLETKKCVAVFNKQGRFAPTYDECITEVIPTDYIILATGQAVGTDFLDEKLASQIKSPRGLINVDTNTYKTSIKNVYAGGDAVTGPVICISAIKAGGIAAKVMSRDLGYKIEKANQSAPLSVDYTKLHAKKAAKLNELPVGERSLDKEDAASLTKDEALAEAGRCMNCGCYAVNASDISPMLMAVDADIVTTHRTIKASDFFTLKLKTDDILEAGELVKEINIKDMSDYTTHYEKLRIRNSIDFAIVSLATAYKIEDDILASLSMVLGGVAPVPYRLKNVEEILVGHTAY
ncbi:FAD-dependent oxidoreductase [Dehalobacter sp. DCM]|nr:FAD-dependent oxidoreductase [Dehalobacter sp. DCM]